MMGFSGAGNLLSSLARPRLFHVAALRVSIRARGAL